MKKRKRWWWWWWGGGRGNTTTGGQEKSTAGRRHNKEWAARWLVLGRMQGVVVGVGGGDDLFSVGEMGLAKGMGRLGLLVGVLRGQMVPRTMFGCAGSEVTAAIVGTRLHNSYSAACSWFMASLLLFLPLPASKKI